MPCAAEPEDPQLACAGISLPRQQAITAMAAIGLKRFFLNYVIYEPLAVCVNHLAESWECLTPS